MFVQSNYSPSSQSNNNSPANNTAGIVNLSGGKVYDIFTIPPVMTFSTVSNAGTGAATVTQYIFNGTTMSAAVTTNGSGAASIVNTYGDGYTGKVYDAAITSWNQGRGVRIKGFTIQSTTTSTGAQTATPFATLQMQILNANAQGGATPVPVDVTAAQRNTQFQVGTLTVISEFYLNTLNQVSVSLPANTTFVFTFTTENGTL
jgi:hypothetical protein